MHFVTLSDLNIDAVPFVLAQPEGSMLRTCLKKFLIVFFGSAIVNASTLCVYSYTGHKKIRISHLSQVA